MVKHVIIISAVYPPEPFVSAQMPRDLAEHLVRQNIRVKVLCPQPSRPATADYGKYTKTGTDLTNREDGVEVVRLPSFAAPRSSVFYRSVESYSFGRHVCRHLAAMPDQPQVIYVNAWPVLAQAMIARCAKKRDIPMVLQIMDVYPESLLGKAPAFMRWALSAPLMRLDRWIAHQATSISVISDSMLQTYIDKSKRGIDPGRVMNIGLWQDERMFEILPDRREACDRYHVPADRFTFLYLGNIGPVAGVDLLIRAFHEAALERAQLLIVGGGSARFACMELAGRLGAVNIHFISDPDMKNVPLLQSMAHVCLLPLKRGAGTSSIPSKLPAYLLSAKPVLATIDAGSDTAAHIHKASCGWVGDPENIAWLAEKMKEVSILPIDELERIGQQGRQYGLEHFSRRRGLQRLADTLLAAAR